MVTRHPKREAQNAIVHTGSQQDGPNDVGRADSDQERSGPNPDVSPEL